MRASRNFLPHRLPATSGGSWDTKISRLHSLETLYALGRIKEIYQRIEIQSEVDHGDLGVAAFAAFIANKEKRNTANNFCNEPLNFLHFANISSYLQDANVFIKGLVDELHDVKTIWEPSKRATRKGFQTAKNINLFANPTGSDATKIDDYPRIRVILF